MAQPLTDAQVASFLVELIGGFTLMIAAGTAVGLVIFAIDTVDDICDALRRRRR